MEAESVSTVTKTLCRHRWDYHNLDLNLQAALNACLPILGASAMFVRFSQEEMTLHYASPSARMSEGVVDRIREVIGNSSRSGLDDSFHVEMDGFHIFGASIVASGNGSGEPPSVLGSSALCYRTLPKDRRDLQKLIFHTNATVGLLFQVLHHRARLFLPFAPRIAERYWTEATRPERKLIPPWEDKQVAKRTATLAFDLRRSTFCMENADSPLAFAAWLDELVQILMGIGHIYGGVFDKFTGDGAIIHFLKNECRAVDGREAVDAAVLCAVAMQHAMRRHIDKLRGFLRLDSKVVGGAIGVDIADAHWSLDHRNNPITVGRGVVNACRLMDKTDAWSVRVTNIAYRGLKVGRSAFIEVPFESKEFSKDMQITAWGIGDARIVPLTATDQEEIDRVINRVYQRSAEPLPTA